MKSNFFALLALTISIAITPPCPLSAQTFNASDPASCGYSLTFADDFKNLEKIDTRATGKPGFNWYTKQFFGGKPTPSAVIETGKGGLTLNGPNGYNGSISTAGPAANADGYVGTVFSGGGYFEASIAFDRSLIDVRHGFPAFWSMAIEHMAQKGKSQWEGQPPGFEHFIEVDFFEANTFAKAGPDTYSGAVHDWYGAWSKERGFSEAMNPNYIIHVPRNTDFAKFHRYGCLVVPSSKSNGWIGFIQYYFDGLPSSDICTWTGNQLPGTPPPSGDRKYSITDADHLNVLLGCGDGDKMHVKYVRVWQIPPPATSAP
ncbi:MAG: hypothetical protein P4L33_15465 [Capsulimonadaceae bacterium]|nr:hypothetical protein [Capsulimonadaceae bacterium]